MLCYKDMTFCPFHEDCDNSENCPRVLREDPGDLPVCQFLEKPKCHSDYN